MCFFIAQPDGKLLSERSNGRKGGTTLQEYPAEGWREKLCSKLSSA